MARLGITTWPLDHFIGPCYASAMQKQHFTRITAALLATAALAFAPSCAPVEAEVEAGQGAPTAHAKTYKLGVEGMSCATNCAPKVKEALESINGVSVVTVDFDTKTAFVTVKDGKTLTTGECDAAFGNEGYFVSTLEEQGAAKPGS